MLKKLNNFALHFETFTYVCTKKKGEISGFKIHQWINSKILRNIVMIIIHAL